MFLKKENGFLIENWNFLSSERDLSTMSKISLSFASHGGNRSERGTALNEFSLTASASNGAMPERV